MNKARRKRVLEIKEEIKELYNIYNKATKLKVCERCFNQEKNYL